MPETSENLVEKSFIGSCQVVREYISDLSLNYISEAVITLQVDSDAEVVLDLENDLKYDRYKYSITGVTGYGPEGREFLRKFPKGITEITFKVTGCRAKFHDIHRPKQNGLGIELVVE